MTVAVNWKLLAGLLVWAVYLSVVLLLVLYGPLWIGIGLAVLGLCVLALLAL